MSRTRSPMRDSNGHLWVPFENEFRQRMLRCTEGPQQGEEINDPRTMTAERPEPRPARAGGYDPENAWLDSWNSY